MSFHQDLSRTSQKMNVNYRRIFAMNEKPKKKVEEKENEKDKKKSNKVYK